MQRTIYEMDAVFAYTKCFLSHKSATMHLVTKTILSTRLVLGVDNFSTTRNVILGILSNLGIKVQIPKGRV